MVNAGIFTVMLGLLSIAQGIMPTITVLVTYILLEKKTLKQDE